MNNQQLENLVKRLSPEAEVAEGKQFLEVTVKPGALKTLALALKENGESSLDFLFCMTGVDYGEELGVVYHLRSTSYQHELVLKTRMANRDNPVIDTVGDIWKTALYHEDEIFDLLGIRFSGHPGLRRLFLEDDAGFPLRKDYVDEVNIVTK